MAIADGLRTLLEYAAAAERWRRAGLRRAAQFSWAKTVDQLIEVWRAALSDAAPPRGRAARAGA